MRRLMHNGTCLDMFFNDNITNQQILEWLRLNLSQLDLNEAHSVTVDLDGDLLRLSGDEDLMEIEIAQLEVIM